jgi:membrane peptidoglycan carboxypeptidase
MVNAIVVTEDQTFWTNNGVDNKAIMRALINNISKYFGQDSPLQGGSTITQQLVKNIFLTNKKTIKRKVQETILAQKLTRQETNLALKESESLLDAQKKAKETILSMYLNFVFFGNQAYGIESAAQNYFKKSASELSLLESTILASLPQAPSLYNPVLDTKRVLGHWYIISGSNHMIMETIDNNPMLT